MVTTFHTKLTLEVKSICANKGGRPVYLVLILERKIMKKLLLTTAALLTINIGASYAFSGNSFYQDTSEVLPKSVITSGLYNINKQAKNNGRNDIFSISSKYGFYIAEGQGDLARHIDEINAMAALDKVQNDEAFADALIKAGKAPFTAAWSLVTAPIDTVSNTVHGIGLTISRLGGLISRERGELEDSRFKELIGVSALKRKYAHELGVDVYSSNENLQEKLNDVAWVSFSGGITARIVFALPENKKVKVPLSAGSSVNTLNKIILDKTPEDLRSMNEDTLKEMGLEENLINKFLGMDWYSPRHQTAITMALKALATVENKEEFVLSATTASNEKGAFYFQYMADMLADYHRESSNLTELFSLGRLVAGQNVKNETVVVIPYDHIQFTPQTENSLAHLEKLISDRGESSGKVAVFLGRVSSATETALLNSGWTVKQLNKFSFGE